MVAGLVMLANGSAPEESFAYRNKLGLPGRADTSYCALRYL